MTRRTIIITCLLWLTGSAAALAEMPTVLLAESTPAGLKITMESQLAPLAINRMHSWVVTLTTANDQPVSGAIVQIDGGMPLHNHGLATRPQISAAGDGKYLLQGVRFHMHGQWELQLRIEHNNITYTAVIQLSL